MNNSGKYVTWHEKGFSIFTDGNERWNRIWIEDVKGNVCYELKRAKSKNGTSILQESFFGELRSTISEGEKNYIDFANIAHTFANLISDKISKAAEEIGIEPNRSRLYLFYYKKMVGK